MPKVLKLDEIKRLIDIPQLIREIETGFVLYSEDQVVVPPVGFLHFDEPPGHPAYPRSLLMDCSEVIRSRMQRTLDAMASRRDRTSIW